MGAIGVFDSGYGGLTILKSLVAHLPQYDFIYYGDNKRAPYGTRSFEMVYDFTLDAVKLLFKKDCPLIILACNTASAKALRTIQQKYLPFYDEKKRVLGVIRPSTEIIGELSKTKHIGLLATEGTVRSESYLLELKKFAPDVKLFQKACPEWVTLIEEGRYDTENGKKQVKEDFEKLLNLSSKIDTVLLACTHYPILQNYLTEISPSHIQIVSQGEIVAKSLLDYLKRHQEIDDSLSKNGKITFFTSGDTKLFDTQAKKLMGMEIISQNID